MLPTSSGALPGSPVLLPVASGMFPVPSTVFPRPCCRPYFGPPTSGGPARRGSARASVHRGAPDVTYKTMGCLREVHRVPTPGMS